MSAPGVVAPFLDRDGAPLAPPSEASASDAQSGPRTSLGTGVTKLVCARIDCASLLRMVLSSDAVFFSSWVYGVIMKKTKP